MVALCRVTWYDKHMLKQNLLLSAALLICAFTSNLFAGVPAAEPGMVRYVLELPKAQGEALVEIIAGKTIETDGVNHYFLGGSIKAEMRDGQKAYVVRTGPIGSTLMAGAPGTPKGSQFVSVSSGLLPCEKQLVVYAPQDLKVSYASWRAKETKTIDKAAETDAIKWAGNNMKAYKEAPEGFTRHVARLQVLPDEAAAQVEVVVGKQIGVAAPDNCYFSGEVKENNIEGWGFTRIDVTIGGLVGAKNEPAAAKKFVRVGNETKLFRYNSRLPLVVYAPSDAEVSYRVWTPDGGRKAMPKG
jgi:ecotin